MDQSFNSSAMGGCDPKPGLFFFDPLADTFGADEFSTPFYRMSSIWPESQKFKRSTIHHDSPNNQVLHSCSSDVLLEHVLDLPYLDGMEHSLMDGRYECLMGDGHPGKTGVVELGRAHHLYPFLGKENLSIVNHVWITEKFFTQGSPWRVS